MYICIAQESAFSVSVTALSVFSVGPKQMSASDSPGGRWNGGSLSSWTWCWPAWSAVSGEWASSSSSTSSLSSMVTSGITILSCTEPLIAPSLRQGDFPRHPVLPVSAVRASPGTSKGSGQQSAHALPQRRRPAGMCGWLPGSFWRPDAERRGAHCFASCQSLPAAAEKDAC